MDSQTVPTVSMEESTMMKANHSNEIDDSEILKRQPSSVPITLHIRYKTQTFPIECDLYDTLKDLKEKIDKMTDVEPHVQKLVNKSITSVKRDDATTTLKDLNILDGQTLLMIGATRSEILSAAGANVPSGASKDSSDDNVSLPHKRESLCKQTKHEKVLKAGRFLVRLYLSLFHWFHYFCT